MAMRRQDLLRDMLSIRNEMNRVFGRGTVEEATERGDWVPPLDLFETADGFTIVVELPGIAAGDLDVSVEDNVLTLRGERPFYSGLPEDAFHRVERRYGAFLRRIVLPESCDTTKVDAAMANGVLEIRIPKAAPPEPRRIEVTGRE